MSSVGIFRPNEQPPKEPVAVQSNRLELLAPAKNADYGIEAIKHGADAVYIGGLRLVLVRQRVTALKISPAYVNLLIVTMRKCLSR